MRLLDRYYGHVQRLEQTDVSGILNKRRTLLPDLREHFHDAEELTGIDWRLIAALAYQESHWNPMAVSPANVRGIMMLTETTADRMNVTDRLDVRQNILAGARYLRLLKDSLPTRIKEPDRTWMALAAYNQGLGPSGGCAYSGATHEFEPRLVAGPKKNPAAIEPQRVFPHAEAWVRARRRSSDLDRIRSHLLRDPAEIRTAVFMGFAAER